MRRLGHSLAAVLLIAGALPPAASGQTAGLGSVSFPNSGARRAQAPFLRGLALLHSFEYDDAAEAFREAQRLDSSFAMAYWGEALTYDHPIWGEYDSTAARAVLSRLAERREARSPQRGQRAGAGLPKGGTGPLRRGQPAGATTGLRGGHGTPAPGVSERRGWGEPACLAPCSACALAGNRICVPRCKPRPSRRRFFAGIRIIPGATHYLIHAYDDPTLAPLGLPVARRYARHRTEGRARAPYAVAHLRAPGIVG